MYRLIAKNILTPMLDFYRGTRITRYLKELEKSQWWSRDKVLELQNQRLRQLVRHAYDNVPYYRRIFDERALKPKDVECSEDLLKLPVLTKQLIRNSFEDLLAQGFSAREARLTSTGGSTGEPLAFYSTRDDECNWASAATIRAFRWAGYEIGDKSVSLRDRPQYRSIMDKFRQASKQFFERTMILDAKEMSMVKLPLFVKKLEEFHPKFIQGFPSAIYLLARFIEREGRSRIRPKAIITTGEQLYDYQKELYGKVFECETYGHYRSREVNNIAAECFEHSGYHITAENVIVEIVDDEDKPVSVGQEGRVLTTNLHNYAMPFIRYDIGDVGLSSDRACPCGRGLPLLAMLNGRTTDVIFTRSGRRIPGIALPWSFFAFMGVEQFQIVQESYEELIVQVVLDGECRQEHVDELATEIIGQYRPILGEDMDITVKFVDQILSTQAGKRRVVISNL